MTMIEHDVARYYARGSLERAIVDGLKAIGRTAEDVQPEDLAGTDEFHIGGQQATAELAEQLELRPGMAVLDIGCGIGGTARFLARRYGCRVTGVDLTPEYVQVAQALTRRFGLDGQVDHRVGSALDLPIGEERFDVATLLHVGMNVPDKEGLCVAVYRALRRGGTFAIYDVMRIGEGDLAFPLPWARSAAMSFVADPPSYRLALTAAGFEIVAERDRRAFAIEFFRTMRARLSESGPPPLGLHILMGPEAPAKIGNLAANLEQGRVAPIEMIARRR